MAINVTEEYKKIKDLIKANGKLLPKDRNAIPQMEMPTRDPKKRAREMDEVALGFSAEQAVVEANRCLQCPKPACMEGCPVNIDIPGFIKKITEEDFKGAVDTIKKTSLLPAICGRVCPQEKQCQGKCTVGKVFKSAEKAVSIGRLERFVADWERENGKVTLPTIAAKTGKKVAIIGAGPAGLVAANRLNKMGYKVTVFDKNEAAGGLLRYGIPNFKLNKAVIDRRINLLVEEGIEFKYNTPINFEGDKVSEADMEKIVGKFDAYVISTGTPTARDLKIPGRELKGVHLALELLSQQNRVLAGMEFSKEERVTAKGKNVLVIGGGDTGSDCIGTSHRQGCKSVTQIEIMPKPVEGPEDPQNPWPNWPRTLKTTSSHEEGCVRRWNINSLEFLGENGKLTGVRVQPIDWKPNPEGGRPIMVEAGEPEIIKAEIVFLAMGFLKPQQPEFPSNVFVCGDAANGASLVVRAMASGRDAAKKVDAYLSK